MAYHWINYRLWLHHHKIWNIPSRWGWESFCQSATNTKFFNFLRFHWILLIAACGLIFSLLSLHSEVGMNPTNGHLWLYFCCCYWYKSAKSSCGIWVNIWITFLIYARTVWKYNEEVLVPYSAAALEWTKLSTNVFIQQLSMLCSQWQLK